MTEIIPSAGFSLESLIRGGIGMLTLGMMSRVSLGHTGRNVFQPPFNLNPVFMCMAAAAVTRVIFPLLWQHQYSLWVGLSQAFWCLAFALFLWRYTLILMRPRVPASGSSR